MNREQEIRNRILELVQDYYDEKWGDEEPFQEGGRVNYAGRVFDSVELVNLVDSGLDFWLTSGKYVEKFEKKLASFLDIKYCSAVNSGSSANLLAFMALTAVELGESRIKRGDEVITVAAGFPTTITPIVQYGAVPVFVDITIPEYNMDVNILESALSEKTKAVMVAHTLGNPIDLQAVRVFCDKNDLWLIEDNCDALGSNYLYNGEWRRTGTIGHIGTSSFYPPHHITTGEGGAVYTNDIKLKRIVESFRDWGRDCWCNSGCDNTCKKRFSQQLGKLPYGYDHKYVYSHFGYNLKITEMQAAVGVAQIDKLARFIEARIHNWNVLRSGLSMLDDVFILPAAQNNSIPSWFGFMLTLKDGVPFTRHDIVNELENKNIQTRTLFAGNILKHPCFDEMRKGKEGYKVVGELKNTDKVMNDSFWVGVYPGLDSARLGYMIDAVKKAVKRFN